MPDDSNNPNPIVPPTAGAPTVEDNEALEEGKRFAKGDYDQRDAGDSYGVRKALKEQVQAHAKCLFRTLYGVILFVLSLFAVLGIWYVGNLCHNPDKLGDVLGKIATHLMAGALGFFAWAWWGKARQ